MLNKRNTQRHAPLLVVSDGRGRVFEVPGLEMLGMRLNKAYRPQKNELIPMPEGSSLFELPDRRPMGFDPLRRRVVILDHYAGQPVYAVAAFMAPAYSQLYRAAYHSNPGAGQLPLFAYTPVGWSKNGFYVTGMRVDNDIRQDLEHFDPPEIERRSRSTLQLYPNNRLVAHLVDRCVRQYRCPAAQNFVMGRWEAPIPTSPVCNARCIGCISKQPDSGVRSTQDRLDFVPTVEEIVAYTVPHLDTAERAVVSFGQGCEGEPLLQADLLEQAIAAMRRLTARGTINLNTNASRPDVIERLCKAGLDSIRVSINSAQPDLYCKYYEPRGYDFAQVLESMKIMRAHHRWISLNYFIFPGLTDHPQEMAALMPILKTYQVDYIQMRNLNMDPEWYITALDLQGQGEASLGLQQWQARVREQVPWIRFGYYNPPREDF